MASHISINELVQTVGQLNTNEFEEFFLPHAVPRLEAQIADRFDLAVMLDHQIDRHCVVEIRQIRHLLILVEAIILSLGYRFERRNVGLQLRAVFHEIGIAHLARFALVDKHDVLFEQRRPRRV